jgi:valyl-tRNA synthetase
LFNSVFDYKQGPCLKFPFPTAFRKVLINQIRILRVPVSKSYQRPFFVSSFFTAKKEAKRLEKEAKLATKAAKTPVAVAGEKKAKIEKEKKDHVPFVNLTPKGEKKGKQVIFIRMLSISYKKTSDLSQPMAAGYDPIAVESAWYDWWKAQGFFSDQAATSRKAKSDDPFVIPLPPPNVTGSLHIGHALTIAIEDALVRWQVIQTLHFALLLRSPFRNRMLGRTALYVPGFDHAGISTQAVVEKRLYKTSQRTRHDLGREKFLETVMDWKNE